MPHTTATAGAVPLAWPRSDVEPRELFRGFVERTTPRALSVAWRLTGGDPCAAEEVLQDAFVAAWSALPGFRGEASLDTWFYRILVRRAHNYRRWRSLRTLWCHPTEQDPADPRGTTDADPMLRRRILWALDQLSSRQRETFVLVHMNGFTVREAAFILQLRPGSVKSHLHRALARLRVELADLNPSKSNRPGDKDEPCE